MALQAARELALQRENMERSQQEVLQWRWREEQQKTRHRLLDSSPRPLPSLGEELRAAAEERCRELAANVSYIVF